MTNGVVKKKTAGTATAHAAADGPAARGDGQAEQEPGRSPAVPPCGEQGGDAEGQGDRLDLAVDAADHEGERGAGVLEPPQCLFLRGQPADERDECQVGRDRDQPAHDAPGDAEQLAQAQGPGEDVGQQGEEVPAAFADVQHRVVAGEDVLRGLAEVVGEVVRLRRVARREQDQGQAQDGAGDERRLRGWGPGPAFRHGGQGQGGEEYEPGHALSRVGRRSVKIT
jgi:hypothetical protein